MPNQEEIDNQQHLLATTRRTLAYLLDQLAAHSSEFVPPSVLHAIHQARTDIRRMKTTLHGWEISVEDELNDEDISEISPLTGRREVTLRISSNLGSAPPPPELIIGREDDLAKIKDRLNINKQQSSPSVQVITAVRGWPGVGKTTLVAALAHDADIMAAFPDGILWAALGQTPNILSKLAGWGIALKVPDFLSIRTVEEASSRLAALLRTMRILLIVDDVWEAEHAIPFMAGGAQCATLITTRVTSIASALVVPDTVYKLDVLSDAKSLELLQKLAPMVVAKHPELCRELVHELEGLPLALQVAGRMLSVDDAYGFSVKDLLKELREGTKLLEAVAPVVHTDMETETTPTVAVLLKKSSDRLDPQTRDCFASLGAFAPKPATFDMEALAAIWLVESPKDIMYRLIDRGLLEHAGNGQYQLHALLVAHAKSLWEY